MDQGFSLTEVLVSLLLMTTTSLALLKQQWQVSQLVNQTQQRVSALTQLDNASERLHVGLPTPTAAAPFGLHFSRSPFPQQAVKSLSGSAIHQQDDALGTQTIHVQLCWSTRSLPPPPGYFMLRRLVIEAPDE